MKIGSGSEPGDLWLSFYAFIFYKNVKCYLSYKPLISALFKQMPLSFLFLLFIIDEGFSYQSFLLIVL